MPDKRALEAFLDFNRNVVYFDSEKGEFVWKDEELKKNYGKTKHRDTSEK